MLQEVHNRAIKIRFCFFFGIFLFLPTGGIANWSRLYRASRRKSIIDTRPISMHFINQL